MDDPSEEAMRCRSPRVAVVILNWNGKEDTKECLSSLLRQEDVVFTIYVVDNGSTDGSLTALTHSYPMVRYLALPENIGFTGGNNAGLAVALREVDPDYVLLFNNDAVAESRMLRKLVDSGETHSGVGLVQPKIRYYRSRELNTAGNLCDIFGAARPRGIHEDDSGQYDSSRTTGFFYASGACVLVKREAIDALDGKLFDSELFAYSDDLDLSWQLRLLGFDILYCPDAICEHKESRTLGKSNPRAFYLAYRNRLRVVAKNYSSLACVVVLPLTIALGSVSAAAAAIAKRNRRFIASYITALLWNCESLRSTIRLRRRVQESRKISDRMIMREMVWAPIDIPSKRLRRGNWSGDSRRA